MDMINLKNNMLMNKIKSLYEAPTTNILVVRFEGGILQNSAKMSAKGWTQGASSWWIDDEE